MPVHTNNLIKVEAMSTSGQKYYLPQSLPISYTDIQSKIMKHTHTKTGDKIVNKTRPRDGPDIEIIGQIPQL